MSKKTATIKEFSKVGWQQFPGHFGGALSKALISSEGEGAINVDYRVSLYQPMAFVEMHAHEFQEQIYHVLKGQALIEFDGNTRVLGEHDVIFIPPGVSHKISNSGLTDLLFIVVSAPALDREPIR